MARQLDLDQLRCDREDGQLAVAFIRERFIFGRWEPACESCARALDDDDRYEIVNLYRDVRFRVDRDRADTNDDDPALKYGPAATDNYGP